MTELDTKDATSPSFWASPRFAWGLVIFGLALFLMAQTPSLLEQVAQNRPQDLRTLGLLVAISVVPVIGLWRLSAPLGLPKAFAFLYLLFPIAIVAVYLLKPFLDRIRRR